MTIEIGNDARSQTGILGDLIDNEGKAWGISNVIWEDKQLFRNLAVVVQGIWIIPSKNGSLGRSLENTSQENRGDI